MFFQGLMVRDVFFRVHPAGDWRGPSLASSTQGEPLEKNDTRSRHRRLSRMLGCDKPHTEFDCWADAENDNAYFCHDGGESLQHERLVLLE